MNGAAATRPRPCETRLRYKPPTLSSPGKLEPATTGFSSKTWGDGEDGQIILPGSDRNNQIESKKGRNLEMIGGSLVASTGSSMVNVKELNGSFHAEGLKIDASAVETDVFNIHGSPQAGPWQRIPDIYLHNILCTGINGSDEGQHSDFLQPQGSIRFVFIDKVTFSSHYQGLFLPAQAPIAGVFLSRIDMSFESVIAQDPTYLLWLIENGKNAKFPTYLSDVWATPREGETLAHDCIWPKEGTKNEAGELVGAEPIFENGVEVAIKFPAAANIHGIVHKGPRPQGHFVTASEVGTGYTNALGYA